MMKRKTVDLEYNTVGSDLDADAGHEHDVGGDKDVFREDV